MYNFSVKLDLDLAKQAKIVAQRKGTTLAGMVRMALVKIVDDFKKENNLI